MKKILILYGLSFFFLIIVVLLIAASMDDDLNGSSEQGKIAETVSKVVKVNFEAKLGDEPTLKIKFNGEEPVFGGVKENGVIIYRTKAENEKDKEKIVWRWFRQSGFNEESTAVLTAYIEAKSGIDTRVVENKVGICRWEGERAAKLTKEKGWEELTEQLSFMYKELANDYLPNIESFKGKTDIPTLKKILSENYDDIEFDAEGVLSRNRGSNVIRSIDVIGREEGEEKFVIEGTMNGELLIGNGDIEGTKASGIAYWGNGAKAYFGEYMSPFGETAFTCTSPFGYRIHPIYGGQSYHSGWDLASSEKDTPIVATKDGKVTFAEYSGNYGNLVILEVEGGLEIYHGHLKEITVTKGQEVKKGDMLGIEGTTGMSTAEHLHWEFKLNGVRVDPDDYANNVLSAGKNYEQVKSEQVKD